MSLRSDTSSPTCCKGSHQCAFGLVCALSSRVCLCACECVRTCVWCCAVVVCQDVHTCLATRCSVHPVLTDMLAALARVCSRIRFTHGHVMHDSRLRRSCSRWSSPSWSRKLMTSRSRTAAAMLPYARRLHEQNQPAETRGRTATRSAQKSSESGAAQCSDPVQCPGQSKHNWPTQHEEHELGVREYSPKFARALQTHDDTA
jgi:hypothetical protein